VVVELLYNVVNVVCQDARSNQLGYFVIVLRFFTITGKHVGISREFPSSVYCVSERDV